MIGEREAKLEERFPSIAWREPLPAQGTEGSHGLACRFCVALYGMRGADIGNLPQTREAFDDHMASFHGVVIG